jgi:hypothetical protein
MLIAFIIRGMDVNALALCLIWQVHAAGVGASLFAGTKENTQLGRIIADLLRFNLTSLNASLATLRSPTLSKKEAEIKRAAEIKNETSVDYLSWGR